MWALVLPVQLLIEYIRAGTLRPYRQRIARSAHYIGPKNAPNSDGKVPNDDVGWRTAGWRPLILGALCISPLFNASTYLWYLSAGMTSAGALAAINSTSSCFVYIFSVLMINEPIRLRMIMAVLISVAGVLFMSVSDGMTAPTVPEPMPISLTSNQTELVVDTLIAGAAVSTDTEMVELHARSAGASPDQPNSFLGDILCLLGAAFSGFFQVTYKQHLSPHRHNTTEFAQTAVGLIGIFTFLVCWIPIPILHLIGWEPFQMPDLHTFGLMSLIGILSAISNACFTPLIALISPLFASVGTMLQIPMVAITDWIVQGKPITFGLMMGSIAICVGFFMLSTAKPAKTIHEEKNRSEHDEGEHVPMLETGFADEETAHLSSQTIGLHTKKEVHGEVVDWAWEAQWSDDDALSNYANQADYQSRN
jgi:drug/metabolite transporter (DMT)-like permease